jgi:hypothetical protein
MDPLEGARRDGPWLVADASIGEIRILEYDTGLTGFVDVHLYANDRRHYVGTFGTIDDVVQVMARWRDTGECLGGRYFWTADLVLVDRADIATIVATVDDLAAQGELHAMALVTDDEEMPDGPAGE